MGFSKNKCRVLQEEESPVTTEADLVERSSVEKDLGFLVDNRLAMHLSRMPLWLRRPMVS